MTPTEQDKELRERIGELIIEAHASGYILGTWAHPNISGDNSREPSNPEDITEQIMQHITADRKRVALEAKIELINNMLNSSPAILHDCGRRLDGVFGKTYLEHKKSELKAQQEEV